MYSYPHKNAYYDIDKSKVLEKINNLKDNNLSLYIHIPFCSTKCGYCNLFSVQAKNDEDIIERYVHTVCRHIKMYGEALSKDNNKITSLIIGGGTPLILSIEQMKLLFSALEENLPVDISNTNFVIETSPNETDFEKIQYLRSIGVKRISIGVQSFIQDELNNLYRNHSVQSAESALDKINKLKFESLNIDLIYGIKNQTIESLTYSIDKAVSYNPSEIFIYPLYVRYGTALYNKMKTDSEMQHKMYEHAVKELTSRGYFQTSMRRFTKTQQNSSSCGFEQSISVGCGGRSYIGDLHFCEPYKTDYKECKSVLTKYIEKKDFFKDLKGYVLDNDELKRRFVIKNLGYYEGVSLLEYKKIFNSELVSDFPFVNEMIQESLIYISEDKLILTEEGRGYSDYILAKWISDRVKERMHDAKRY